MSRKEFHSDFSEILKQKKGFSKADWCVMIPANSLLHIRSQTNSMYFNVRRYIIDNAQLRKNNE